MAEHETVMNGKIIKGIGGFYYVHDGIGQIYECRAKGIFRNRKMKPLVGDRVRIQVLDEKEKVGSLTEIYPRTNQLIRPATANIDQALILFAVASPKPNLDLLDRLLISMGLQQIPCLICFGKMDLAEDETENRLREIYGNTGFPLLFISNYENRGLDRVERLLEGKTTALAGPSGVGKSSLLNRLIPDAKMETGAVSEKIQRGRHTTRHSELFYMKPHTFVMDTPGFSSMDIGGIPCEELKNHYPEFQKYEGQCRFTGCVHVSEPDCRVKRAAEAGEIAEHRYDSYRFLYEELKAVRKKW